MANPSINDQFWFDQSKKLVDISRESRDAAAIRLQQFAGWAWTLFSGVTGISLAYAGKPLSTSATILVGAASYSILLVYWLATQATIPKALEFDPRSPTSIEQHFQLDVRYRQRKLNITLFFGLLSATLVGLSLLLIVSSLRAPSASTPSEVKVFGTLITSKSWTSLTVSGEIPQQNIAVLVRVNDDSGKHIDNNYSMRLVSSRIQLAVPLGVLPLKPSQVYVELTCIQKDGTKIVYIPKVESGEN